MTRHQETCEVPFSADSMMQLVENIEAYPQFLPWCTKAKIITMEQEDNKKTKAFTADLTVGYGLLSSTFRSRVEVDYEKREIHVSYVDGPLKELRNHWRFEVLATNASRIHFDLEISLNKAPMQKVFSTVFSTAFERMLKAFVDRAYTLYTPKETT